MASSASHPATTPTPDPSTNQRHTGRCRQPHTVGANPPTATINQPHRQQRVHAQQPHPEYHDGRGEHGCHETGHRQACRPRRGIVGHAANLTRVQLPSRARS